MSKKLSIDFITLQLTYLSRQNATQWLCPGRMPTWSERFISSGDKFTSLGRGPQQSTTRREQTNYLELLFYVGIPTSEISISVLKLFVYLCIYILSMGHSHIQQTVLMMSLLQNSPLFYFTSCDMINMPPGNSRQLFW